ncbi:MAG: hypothetical protein GWN46_00010, partial [Gammaproteobacteria bacterium]|nr:hypothetical protein [Gammaproteobacteria bacterium]
WNRLPGDVPPPVRRLLRRCLEKDAEHRMHHAADVRIEIEHAFDEPEETPAQPVSRLTGRGFGAALVATLLVGLAIGYVARALRSSDPPQSVGRMVSSIAAPPGVRLAVEQPPLALSPNGEELAFIGNDAEGMSHV